MRKFLYGVLTALTAWFGPPAWSADLTVEKTFASAADFEVFSRDSGIDLTAAPGAITLCHACKKGAVVSPIIDMAATTNRDAIAPLFKIRSLDLQWRAIAPGSASVKIEARSGPSACPDDTWSPWTGADRALPARFVQLRAALASGGDDVTPSLARLTLTARGECVATPESQGYALRDFRNPPLRSPAPSDPAQPPDPMPDIPPRLVLTCTETPGVLAVAAGAFDSASKSFRFAAFGQEPVLLPGRGTDSDTRHALFSWKLTPGLNTLSVTTLNATNRESAAATVSLDWKPTPPPNLEQP